MAWLQSKNQTFFLHKFRRKTVWRNLTVQCLLVISYLLKHLIIRHIDILHTFLKFKNFIHELCSMVFRFNKKNVSHISDVEGLDEWYDGAKILILSRSNFFQISLKVIGYDAFIFSLYLWLHCVPVAYSFASVFINEWLKKNGVCISLHLRASNDRFYSPYMYQNFFKLV